MDKDKKMFILKWCYQMAKKPSNFRNSTMIYSGEKRINLDEFADMIEEWFVEIADNEDS